MEWIKRSKDLPVQPPRPMPRPIWEVCAGRGLDSLEKIESFFSPRLVDLANPYSLHEMDKAVGRLVRAQQAGESVGIYGDFDLDGTPGIVLLNDAFQKMGLKVASVFQPLRMLDGYGLHAHRVQEMHEKGVTLLVTVDVGITDIEAVKTANLMGVDVIITDHHLPKSKLPEAYAIVNPNKGNCTSKLQHLCGTGVAFYLVLALRSRLKEQNLLVEDFDPKELLDLFALATISDQVPLLGENRVLVKHGLRELSKGRRPGLKVLVEALGMGGRKLNSKDVAFRLAPKLNALTRLEEGIFARDILLSKDLKEAEAKVALMLEINKKRVEYQKSASEIARNLMTGMSKDSFIWVCSHEFHAGVISLLASELLEEYGVPVFVGTKGPGGTIKGSARSPHEGFHLQKILGETAEVLEKFGGHALAAGFSMREGQEEAFRNLLAAAVPASGADRTGERHYDCLLEISDLNPELMKWYEEMGPFGQGFESPIFRLNNLSVYEVKELRGGYLKYSFQKDGQILKAPWFDNPVKFDMGEKVDILFEPQWNEFRGQRNIEGLLLSAKRCQAT